MRIQDYAVDCAKSAAIDLFRYARAVPLDKLDWEPEGARSVMSVCREIGMTPTWTMSAFGQERKEWRSADSEAQKNVMESWKTTEECEAQFNKRFKAVEEFFRGMTDQDLERRKWLPYNGGRDHTWLEMLDYPRWNATYHLGQIAYIQMMYGDKEMH